MFFVLLALVYTESTKSTSLQENAGMQPQHANAFRFNNLGATGLRSTSPPQYSRTVYYAQMDVADISVPSRDGAYVNGLSLDGARWNLQVNDKKPF